MDANLLQESLIRARTLITTGEKHCNYDRVVKFAKEYEAHITGEDMDTYLKRFSLRESEAMFKQRLKLTNAISPAVTNSLMKPFYKVSRNNNVSKKYDFKNTGLNGRVDTMLNDFNSDMMDNTNGLDTWLRTRFVELAFTDPNSFIVIEWDAAPAGKTIKPRPFEVRSDEAINYEYKGNVLEWLHVSTKIKYNKVEGGKIKAKQGVKYTHYAQGITIVFEQIDEVYLGKIQFAPGANQTYETISSIKFLVSIHDTTLDYVPAFRIGYSRDLKTRGNTYVNPFHPAMTYLRKMLKTTSELDITMTGHVFPQKWQYIQRCTGASPTEPCDNGRCTTRNNEPCTACNGTGHRVILSAQEAMYIPLPDDPKEMYDLDKMQSYKSPPIDLVTFQEKYIQGLKQDTHLAVYNSNMFLASDAQFAKTATEIDANMDGVYDAIEPFSERYSKVWKLTVYTCAVLAGFNVNSDDFELIHTFPADPKLKTLSILLGDLKAVNDSSAPSFTRDIINNDIAEVVFNGDHEALRKYQVRHIFYPFNGKSADEITTMLSTQYVSDLTKILYSNFEGIFSEIEREHIDFYELDTARQWQIVDDMVIKWKDEILGNDPIRANMDLLLGNAQQPNTETTDGSNDAEAGATDSTDVQGGEATPADGSATE